jgi:Peptidase inhibitor I78 family
MSQSMRNLVALAPLLVAGCSTMAAEEPQPPLHGATSGYKCRNEGLDAFVGRESTSEVGAELLSKSGARTLRWVRPGMMITMEYSEERVTVHLGPDGRIARVTCG